MVFALLSFFRGKLFVPKKLRRLTLSVFWLEPNFISNYIDIWIKFDIGLLIRFYFHNVIFLPYVHENVVQVGVISFFHLNFWVILVSFYFRRLAFVHLTA